MDVTAIATELQDFLLPVAAIGVAVLTVKVFIWSFKQLNKAV